MFFILLNRQTPQPLYTRLPIRNNVNLLLGVKVWYAFTPSSRLNFEMGKKWVRYHNFYISDFLLTYKCTASLK